MTTVHLDAASARTLLTAIHRPCPWCRWCQTRRVLTAVWRGLDLASRIAIGVWRALVLSAGFAAVVFAVNHVGDRGPAMAAGLALIPLGYGLLEFDAWMGRR
jgi:hypothetical protein